jgi:RimJ/RimL family protein N-acetyltransferase
LRPAVAEDAGALAARRSDPEVAELQSWEAPYPIERARDLISEIVRRPDPEHDEWWMLTVVRTEDSAILGDIVFKLGWGGRSAEVGYALAREAWGHGYATEAFSALIGRLFDGFDVTRIGAMLHPENTRSAMVLERTGFEFEGRTHLSYWVGDENTDDLLYGITRAGWDSWRKRQRTAPDHVDLIEVTSANAVAVNRLATHQSQRRFVAPVTKSLADALVPPMVDGRQLEPWYRAVEADQEIVGFVMLSLPNDVHIEPYLWRFMIDRRHQRRGVGSRALEIVIEQCRTWGAESLLVSWAPGRGSPAPLYLERGFVATGNVDDGEIEARLVID